MIVNRIVDAKYKDDLSGSGAKEHGGRWNPKGKPAMYCSEHISLCMLENMVYMTNDIIKRPFCLIQLDIPDEFIQEINHQALKKSWYEDIDYTRWLGAQFLNQDGFILKVPSAIVHEEFNFMINTQHERMKEVKIIQQRPYFFDQRLF